MAWTEVCKINFESACTGLINFKRQSVNKAINQLSKESGISARTLHRWWHDIQKKKEESVAEIEKIIEKNKNVFAKNGKDLESFDNTRKNTTDKSVKMSNFYKPIPFKCIGCGRQEPEIKPALAGTGKPFGIKSKYFSICNSCRLKSSSASKVDPESGHRFVCPHCSKSHYVSWQSLYKIVDKQREVQNGEKS